MRIKKGFTLAEILIVLMVIGVIATMTIPSLMKGVTESQFKTAYKKAYNTIVNLAAMERISGLLPATKGQVPALNWYTSMQNNLSVREYVSKTSVAINGTGAVAQPSDYHTTFTPAASHFNAIGSASADWIVTEDGLAYNVFTPATSGTCGLKSTINSQTSIANTITNSCVVVVVDVNGLSKGPNAFDSQMTKLDGTNAGNIKLDTLVGDKYYIFIGTDGATSGSRINTITGRIVNDAK